MRKEIFFKNITNGIFELNENLKSIIRKGMGEKKGMTIENPQKINNTHDFIIQFRVRFQFGLNCQENGSLRT